MKRTRKPSSPAWWFVSDLDGTLLDEVTYEFAPARPALAALRESNTPLILASSKTRGEMEAIAAELGIAGPLILENGGAVLWPSPAGGYEAIPLGDPTPDLARHLADLAVECAATVRGFSSLSCAELARLTGLSAAAARQARERRYSEPFLLADDRRAPCLAAAAARRGLRVTRGGRFFHLMGDTDKGRAVRFILSRWARRGLEATTVALGDAANDLAMLQAVDRPILMPRRQGGVARELADFLPGAEVAPGAGPQGWNAAVLTVVAGEYLPRNPPCES